MTKEYHVFTNIQSDHQQAFVFEIDRHEDINFISLEELWIVTVQDKGEVKSRINLRQMISGIGHQVGGNIDDDKMTQVLDVFNDVLDDQKRLEIQIDLCEKEVNNATNDSEKLLKAGELSSILHNENNNLGVQKLIDSIIKKRTDKL